MFLNISALLFFYSCSLKSHVLYVFGSQFFVVLSSLLIRTITEQILCPELKHTRHNCNLQNYDWNNYWELCKNQNHDWKGNRNGKKIFCFQCLVQFCSRTILFFLSVMFLVFIFKKWFNVSFGFYLFCSILFCSRPDYHTLTSVCPYYTIHVYANTIP